VKTTTQGLACPRIMSTDVDDLKLLAAVGNSGLLRPEGPYE